MSRRRATILQLIFIWGLCLVMSISAMGVSVFVLTKERIDYSCERSGHGFAPRYNVEPPNPELVNLLDIAGTGAKLEAVDKMSKKVYVCDVCTYCGKSVTKTNGQ